MITDLRRLLPSLVLARLAVAVAWVAAGVWRGGSQPTDRLRMEGLLAWDGTWYRDIVVFGYAGLPDEALRFFPAYPLLVRAIGLPLGDPQDHRAAVGWVLVVVANVAAVVAAVLVRRLVLAERHDPALADRAAVALTLFPSAFVLVWAYSEALFLVAGIGVFWAVRTRRWEWAIVAGLVAGATRPVGLLLVVPVAIEAARCWRVSGWPERLRSGVAVAAPAISTAVWLLWAQPLTGQWSYPFTGQSEFRGEAQNPLLRVVRGFGDLVGDEMFGDGLHIPFAVVFVVLVIVVFRNFPVSYGAFAASVAVVALGADNLNSLERYMLNAFPVVLAIAVLCSTPRRSMLAGAVGVAGIVSLSTLAWVGLYVP